MNYIKLLNLAIHPFAIISVFISLFIFFKLSGVDGLISLDLIKKNYSMIMYNVNANIVLAIILFSLIYIFVTTLSLPVATYLTIIGGVVFGPYKGTIIVLISATIGAIFIFLIFRYASNYFSKKIDNKYLENIKHGFNRNPLVYLLLLRLLPVFHFFIVNIVSAIMNVKLGQYVIATFIGMVPMTFFYCSIGSNADLLINTDVLFSYKLLYNFNFLIPFIGIIVILFATFIYKRKIGVKKDG